MENNQIIGYVVKDAPNMNFSPSLKYDQFFKEFDDKTEYCPKYYYERGYMVYFVLSSDDKKYDLVIIDQKYILSPAKTEYYYFDECIQDVMEVGGSVEYGILTRYSEV